mgnify:FL=1
MNRIFLPLVAVALAPFAASAEGFSSGYVTGFNSEAECMDTARNSLDAHFRENGGTPDTGEGSYSIYGFDVPPGITQVAIVCSEHDGSVVATVTGYSLVENGTRLETVQTMIDRINGTFAPALPTNPPAGNK